MTADLIDLAVAADEEAFRQLVAPFESHGPHQRQPNWRLSPLSAVDSGYAVD